MARAAPFLRICGPAAASLLVNGLIVAALLGLQMRRANERSPASRITVVSFAVPKGDDQGDEDSPAEASQASLSAPQPPSPAEPQPQAAPVTPLPELRPAIPVVARLPAATSSIPAPTIAAPAPAGPQRSPTGAPTKANSSIEASAARRGVADGPDAKAPSGTSRSYAARVRSWLYAHKVYPRRARMRREEGLVRVRFVLDREGVLVEGAVTGRSGNAVLDEEAEAMMHRSSPYPRAPADLPGDRIEFDAPIEFALPS